MALHIVQDMREWKKTWTSHLLAILGVGRGGRPQIRPSYVIGRTPAVPRRVPLHSFKKRSQSCRVRPKRGTLLRQGQARPLRKRGLLQVLCRYGGGEVLSGLVCGAECCGSPPTLHSIRLRSWTRRTAPDRVAIPKPLRQSSGTVHIGTHVAVPAPEYGRMPVGQSPGFPGRSTEREPVLTRPTTYEGRLDENGTSTGRCGGSRSTSGPVSIFHYFFLNC